MRRSLWKGIKCWLGSLRRVKDMVRSDVKDKSLIIMPNMSNGSLRVHVGKDKREVRLSPARVGYRIGSFVTTKKLGAIHKFEEKRGKRKS